MNRRFEMHQYRQVLSRMRLGESDRQIDASGLMGRRTAAKLRKKATKAGWLGPDKPLPTEAELFEALNRPRAAQARAHSSLEGHRAQIERWVEEHISGVLIHRTLKQRFGYRGSYSSVRRFIQGVTETTPRATMVLQFDPGEAAQVDFGAGPELSRVRLNPLLYACTIFGYFLVSGRFSMARNTSITLGGHFDEFISQQLAEGRYGSASEVIRAALRLLEERDEKVRALRQALREGEASGFESYSLKSVISELDRSASG